MQKFKFGQKVVADPGGHPSGKIGFLLTTEEDSDGKHQVQIGSSVVPLAYREPSSRDERGSGVTFWLEGLV